jgi:hypothetical protein
MARRVEHLGLKLADSEALAVAKQMVEVAAISFPIRRVEDRAENPLHITDMLADADPGARFSP